jgi:hypothetical protein
MAFSVQLVITTWPKGYASASIARTPPPWALSGFFYYLCFYPPFPVKFCHAKQYTKRGVIQTWALLLQQIFTRALHRWFFSRVAVYTFYVTFFVLGMASVFLDCNFSIILSPNCLLGNFHLYCEIPGLICSSSHLSPLVSYWSDMISELCNVGIWILRSSFQFFTAYSSLQFPKFSTSDCHVDCASYGVYFSIHLFLEYAEVDAANTRLAEYFGPCRYA